MLSDLTSKPILHCYTWLKDAHGLFDYESNELTNSSSPLGKGGKITRNEEEHTTTFIPNKQEESFFLTGSVAVNFNTPSDAIAYFYEDGRKIKLSRNIEKEYIYNKTNIVIVQEKLWRLLKQTETKGIKKEYQSNFTYDFILNDTIRFGRVQFAVRYIHSPTKCASVNNIYLPNESPVHSNKKCFLCKKEEKDSDKDPILKVCQCSDSPFMHLACFKEYVLHSKNFGYKEEKYVNGNLTFIKVYNFVCDLCNEPYNAIVRRGDKEFNLLPYVKPNPNVNHLVLESLNFLKEGIFTTLIMIFLFPKKKDEFFLGRGHEATFKVSDISISRVHCRIYLNDNGKISLDDLGSKFGTLILLRDDTEVDEIIRKKMKIQIGRSVLWIDDKNDE